MAGLPQFPISTQTDPYWEIPMYDADRKPLSIEGRVFEAWITPAVTKQGVAVPVKEIKVLTFQDGLSLVPPTDGTGDQSVRNTLVHQVSRDFAQKNFPRGELTADILEVVDGARRLFAPVRLFYADPAQIREFVADRAGITFGPGRQPIVTTVAIAGQTGRRGAGFLTGDGAPSLADGEDGDYWIDDSVAPRLIYGPKAGGAWPAQGDPFVTDLTPELETARDVAVSARDDAAVSRSQALIAAERSEVAATQAVAKAGQFSTLAALQALPAPTVITAAEVTADGAKNGGYQYDPANAAAGWVKKSSATVPALDARTAPFDPTESNVAGDLYVILDEIRRILGRYDAAGRLHTQFGPRMPFGGALLDASAPDSIEGDLLVLPDADGRTLLLIKANGEIVGKITSPEIIAARGSKASLADRLAVSVFPNGLLRSPRWGQANLRQAHMRLMQRSLGVATQLDIVAIGDSYTDEAARWLQQFTERLVARYGDAGPGFVSFALQRGGARPTLAVPNYAGAWTIARWTAQTADTSSVTSSTVGNTATCTIPAGMSDVMLLYLPTADGAVRYRFRPADAWTPLPLTGTGVALLSGLPSEASTLTIEVTGGTVSLNAVNIRSAAPGVRVHKCAVSGVRAKNFAETDGPVRRAHYAALGGHCYAIMIGANDQPSGGAGEFRTYLDAMVAGIRAVSTVADLAFIAQPENNLARPRPMKDYAQVHYEVAVANGGAFLDLQADFGPDPALYASNGLFPLMLADGLHPDPATGGYLIASAVLEAFNVD